MANHQKEFHILVDHREKGSTLAELLEKEERLKIEYKQLFAGDYQLENLITIERKTVLDLVVSIIDGRLFSQCSRLVKRAERPVLLIEGDLEHPPGEMDFRSMEGALISVAVFWQIPILYSPYPEKSVGILNTMLNQLCKKWEEILPRMGYKPKKLKKRKLYILQGLPEIGPRRAKVLLHHFGSVEAVMTATANELEEVEGIGPCIAGKIREVLEDGGEGKTGGEAGQKS